MLRISDLIKEWKNKNLLWNLSASKDFSDLLYTHPSYLEKINISEGPDVYIHTDYCRDVLKYLELSNHYFQNFSYSKQEQELLNKDEDPYKKYNKRRSYYDDPLFHYYERDYLEKEINKIIFEDKSSNGFKTRITLISSERILNDLEIYQFNSIKYVHFPELGFPEFFALKLKLKIESNKYSTREIDVYYFFMENVNFLRNILFAYNLKLFYIYYMHDGKGFGYNNHSNLWILKYLIFLETKYLILYTMYFRKDEIVNGDYLSYETVDQFHQSILEKEEFLRKIPNHLLGSYQIKAFHENRLRNVVWTRPVLKNIK